jgi:hypothetical protein
VLLKRVGWSPAAAAPQPAGAGAAGGAAKA